MKKVLPVDADNVFCFLNEFKLRPAKNPTWSCMDKFGGEKSTTMELRIQIDHKIWQKPANIPGATSIFWFEPEIILIR